MVCPNGLCEFAPYITVFDSFEFGIPHLSQECPPRERSFPQMVGTQVKLEEPTIQFGAMHSKL